MKYQSPYSGAHTIYLHHEGNDVKEYDEASIANLPPLEVDRQALAQLAEVGVIPSPASPYKNFKILNAGDHATFDKQTDSLVCGTHFAYGRSDSAHQTLELNQFHEKLLSATQRSVSASSDKILFLSAGKDSTAIAIAMHELGLSQNCCAITYRAKEQDESEIARKITSDIQMPHRIIDMTSYKVSADKMEAFFAAQIAPSLDLCATIYLHCGLEAFSGAELIDGMGNDLFIGHIPAPSELKAAHYQRMVPHSVKKQIGKWRHFHQYFMLGAKTRSEMVGLWSYLSSSPLADALMPYDKRRQAWYELDKQNTASDYLDIRASLRGRYIDQEKFIRKIKNACHAYDLTLSLPWTDPDLASFCHNLDDAHLFDKNALKNKLFLRDYLTSKTAIDYTKEPKYAFAYDFKAFVKDNISFVTDVILTNDLIDKTLTKRCFDTALKQENYGLIYQLFLLLGWHQFSVFVKR